MEFSIKTLSPEAAKTGCTVVGVYASPSASSSASSSPGGELSPAAQRVDRAAKGALKKALSDLSGKTGSTLLLRALPGVGAERVLLVGLGERKAFGEAAYREALRAAASALKELGARDAALFLVELKVGARSPAWNLRHAVLGVREAFYRFDQLKSRKKTPAPALQHVVFSLTSRFELRGALAEAVATADGVDLAKTLGNLPPNICTPAYLAGEARKLARQYKLGIKVLERRDMAKLGMGALLAVASASHQPPKLIVLHYQGKKNQKPLALVGKGITFDTGGISLKPAGEMDEMKYDMSGAGAVLGAIRALAGMKAPVNVVGVIPTCENMPGGQATRPGDIVTTLSGQTVEILNTDAEGRLILCDALSYAERFRPEAVIDIATLTGACVIALGHVASGLFANDAKLAEELRAAADDAWDRVWPMPLWDDYQEQLRSNFADMANIGGRPAGSITAASFLARFTRKLRWAHLDVAGTAWKSGRDKGSTGRPVPLLVRFALRRAGQK